MPSHFLASVVLGLASLSFAASSARAQTFHIDITTAPLTAPANAANGPFLLDLQLNSGSTLNNNTAVINHFTFGGGGAPFGAANVFGGASGSLATSVTLSDTLAFNEFFQSFTAGSLLSFDVTLTRNLDAGGTPDIFSVALLDSSLFNLPTTGFADQLLSVNLPAATTGFQTFTATGSYGGIRVSVIPVPEPATYGLAGGAMVLAIALVRRARRTRGAFNGG